MYQPDDTLRQSLRQQLEEFLETNEGEKVRNSKWQIAARRGERKVRNSKWQIASQKGRVFPSNKIDNRSQD